MKTLILALFTFCAAAFPQGVTLLSPNGGQAFHAGDRVAVTWNANTAITSVRVDLSLSDGLSWIRLGTSSNPGTFYWFVPYLLHDTPRARLRVTAEDVFNPPSDVSDASFSIAAATPDAYEPNNDLAHARAMSLGDTLNNAYVLAQACDSANMDSLGCDYDLDYFRLTVGAGKALNIRIFCQDSGEHGTPRVDLCDSLGRNLFNTTDRQLTWNTAYAGTYYIAVRPIGEWSFYGLVATASSELPSIRLLSPNGNETFNPGDYIHITWTASSSIPLVRVEFSPDNGNSWNYLGNASNPGYFPWTVPYRKNGASQALFRVTGLTSGTQPWDLSDTSFTILPAAPDAYEPNDDISHAYPVTLGSTILNALVMADICDSGNTVTCSGEDVDFFKFTATAGTAVELKFENPDSCNMGDLEMALLNQAGSILFAQRTTQTNYNIQSSGTYYVRIRETGQWAKYNLKLSVVDASAWITLLTPVATDTFNAGDPINISWSASPSVTEVEIDYSLSGGLSWTYFCGARLTNTVTWYAPYLMKTNNAIKFRVIARSVANSTSDETDNNMTILAAAPDAYEPNNTLSQAVRITLNDTVKNGVVIKGLCDSSRFDSIACSSEEDYFKFEAQRGNLVMIHCQDVDSGSYGRTDMNLIDSSGRSIVGTTNNRFYFVPSYTGTHYIRISEQWGYTVYNLLTRSIPLENIESAILPSDSLAVTVDSLNDSAFTLRLRFPANRISVNLHLASRTDVDFLVGKIPDGFLESAGFGLKFLKTFLFSCAEALDSLVSRAEIEFDYAPESLAAMSESSLTVRYFDEKENRWIPVAFTLDTVGNRIVAYVTHFSIYGVFGSEGIIKEEHGKSPAKTLALKASPNPANPTVQLNFTIPGQTLVNLEIFALNGRKVADLVRGNMMPGQYTLSWSGGSQASGLYLAVIKAGAMQKQEAFFLIK